jgi:hypothetical protein
LEKINNFTILTGTSLAMELHHHISTPTFVGDLNDYNATLGYKAVKNEWNTDASITVGGNSQTYSVENSQTDHQF